jgi:hypothetical protein
VDFLADGSVSDGRVPTHSDSNTEADANSYTNAVSDAVCWVPVAYPYADSNPHTYTNPYTNAYPHTYADSNPYTFAFTRPRLRINAGVLEEPSWVVACHSIELGYGHLRSDPVVGDIKPTCAG